MCGIVGYVGRRQARDILIEGLRRLEYRGYDSAGIVVQGRGGLASEKHVGRIDLLEAEIRRRSLTGRAGLGHTLWATQGRVSGANAQPHFSCDRKIAVVHNGVIENSAELRERLEKNHRFSSETDSELIPHLIEDLYARNGGDILAAVNLAVEKIRGALAIGVLHADHPNCLCVARVDSPLVVGLGEGETFLASDIPALLPHTRRIVPLRDHEVARISPEGVRIFDRRLHSLNRPPTTIDWDLPDPAWSGPSDSMAREIGEQGLTLASEIAAWDEGLQKVRLPREIDRVVAVACGSSYHAGLAAKPAIEEAARIPVEVALASEFRYGGRPLDRGTLVLAISQSGETADTLASVRLAREAGAPILALTNVKESSLARAADHALCMRAGPERGVVATKTYTSQLLNLSLLALHLGRSRGCLASARFDELLGAARLVPGHVQRILARDTLIRNCARKYQEGREFVFIGRRHNLATACEGALKMTELTHLTAEACAAGELKHGPLALVDHRTVCVAVAPRGLATDRMISNIREVRARGGVILSIATEGDGRVAEISDHVIEIPDCEEMFSPILAVVPLQLLAYHRAIGLERDVDRPRNLAKSVTVE